MASLDFAVALAANATVLVAAVLIHAGLLVLHGRRLQPFRPLCCGLLFGGAAVAAMLVPVHWAPGVILDVRTAPVAFAAPFGGPLAGLIAAALPTAYRLWLGGTGAVAGAANILGAAAVGLALATILRIRAPAPDDAALGDAASVRWYHVVIVASLLPLVAYLAIQLLPSTEHRDGLARAVGAAGILMLAAAAAAFGGLLVLNIRRHAVQGRLSASERGLAAMMANVQGVFFRRRRSKGGEVSFPLLAGRVDELLGTAATANAASTRDPFLGLEPEDRQALLAAFDASLHDGAPVALDLRLAPASGMRQKRWLHVAASLTREDDGAVHWDGFVNDITARKSAEIALAEARTVLEAMAGTDPLTGLANRRLFDERLGEEWQRAMRSGAALSLVLLDVDHFKAYNDTQGHPAGDECLRRLASLIVTGVRRPTDLAARLGGEEFALLLPGTREAEALAFAEQLRAMIEGQSDLHAAGGVVTISAGIATARPGTDLPGTADTADLLTRADAALYRAKAAGRNCVRSADAASDAVAA